MHQNRVDPSGELFATAHRGAMMGNRGGKIHRPDGSLSRRRWASKAWITCRLQFNGRRRVVMGPGYTELFFLDEATALAAGHRPCFECRRRDAKAFAAAWGEGRGWERAARAAEMDACLHAERVARGVKPGGVKRTHPARLESLPAGAMIRLWGAPWLVTEGWLLRWSFAGYDQAIARPAQLDAPVELLTPPSIVAALRAGYRPEMDAAIV